jgi:hypothetical protein
VAKLNYVVPLAVLAIAAPILGATPAYAQPGGDQSCRFSAGVGPNAACASAPQDDYPDIYWPPGGLGFFPGSGMRGVWGRY